MLLTVLRWWSLCGFVVFIFIVFPYSLSSCFFIFFSIVITLLGEEGVGLCASRAFVYVCLLAAVCDCGTPWTLLLTFIQYEMTIPYYFLLLL